MNTMTNTVATKPFSVERLRKDAGVAFTATAQNFTCKVTFVYGGLTGNTKVVNGVTWYEAYGTFSFDNPSITIPYGDTATIKIKMDNNASTNGWKLRTFIPKATNPGGGPPNTGTDPNGDITVQDNNTVAGTYYYGLYLESPSQNQYTSYDPAIIQEGGGTGTGNA